MPVSLSLDLAASLVRNNVAREECLRYLDLVKTKAESRDDAALLQRIAEIERLVRW